MYLMAILDFCVKMKWKLQTDVIILVVDLSKRGPLGINICIPIQKLNFEVDAGGHFRFSPPGKNAGIFGRDL